MNKTLTPTISGIAMAMAAASCFAGPITGGNLVVTQIGADNRIALPNGNATEWFINEFDKTPLSARIQQIAFPVAPSGADRALTQGGLSTSVGFITASVNGQYLTVVGYDAAVGTVGVSATPASTVNRVIGRVDIASGIVDTTTFLTAQYSSDNIRSAVTVDGSAYYTAGTSTAAPSFTGGIWYSSHGDPTAGGAFRTNINNNPNNTRNINIFGNQLYVSTSSGSFRGVNQVGVGLPTAADIVFLLSGFEAEFMPTNLSPSQYDFVKFGDTMYVADDRTSGTFTARRGIQKWQFDGTNWIYKYSMTNNPAAAGGYRTLAGEEIAPGVVRLYTITAETSQNKLVSVDDIITDTSNASVFTVLQTALPFTIIRGVEIVPANANPTNTVTGVVDYGNVGPTYNSGPFPGSIPVSFRDAANAEIATGTASYNAVTGAFSASVPGAVVVPYRVSFKLGFWLRKTMPNPADPAAPVGNYNFGTVAPMVGDADDDNEITNSDYSIWAGSNGNSVTPNTGADFDGDGEITNSDYALWASTNGNSGDN